MSLKQHEMLDLTMRDLLYLFRRCEELASVIERGRKNGGRYGTTEALVRQSAEFVAEVRRLQKAASGKTAPYVPSEHRYPEGDE